MLQHKSRYFQLIRVNPVVQVLNARQKVYFLFNRGSGESREEPRDNSRPESRVHYIECLQVTSIPTYKWQVLVKGDSPG